MAAHYTQQNTVYSFSRKKASILVVYYFTIESNNYDNRAMSLVEEVSSGNLLEKDWERLF